MRFFFSFCDPCRIQTCNPHIRSVVLYSVELMDPGAASRQTGEAASAGRGMPFLFLKSDQLALVLAVRTRLELATYGVTGRYSNQLNYRTSSYFSKVLRNRFFSAQVPSISKAGAKVLLFFDMTKFFSKKMHFYPHFF